MPLTPAQENMIQQQVGGGVVGPPVARARPNTWITDTVYRFMIFYQLIMAGNANGGFDVPGLESITVQSFLQWLEVQHD